MREYYIVRNTYNPDDIELFDSRTAIEEYMTKTTGEEWKVASLNYHFKNSIKKVAVYKGWKIYLKPVRESNRKKERKQKRSIERKGTIVGNKLS